MEEENMETQSNNKIIPTFLSQNTNTTHDVQKSLHVFRRSRKRWTKHGDRVIVVDEKEKEKEENEDEMNGEDDREEIERKINALQRIVPNGEAYGVDKLFDETASYIVALQYQVKALKALTGFFQKLEKEKTKLGG
ncbi:uncharacterized protein [Cicer arietinum]|uniref:Transcription factor PAR1 n=1 Tax=Cicer arietinum TaxID=3827 RepID=A0A1S2XLX2_CICAR|nr:transcription factor PAR1 [Cicer arietinum]